MTQDLWEAMDTKVLDFAHSVTLKSLVLEQLNTGVKLEQTRLQKRGVFQRSPPQSVGANVPNSIFSLGQAFLAP
jgi:Rrf2 family iron-sulfur cluster assembly transcriptional regulator